MFVTEEKPIETFRACLTRVQLTRPRAYCIDHLVVRPGRAAELEAAIRDSTLDRQKGGHNGDKYNQ